jgi:hypothetical protein
MKILHVSKSTRRNLYDKKRGNVSRIPSVIHSAWVSSNTLANNNN